MEIGVALSGCDMGGICAWKILNEIQSYGFEIGMVSACCIPAIAALMYADGCREDKMESLSGKFLQDTREHDLEAAVRNFSSAFRRGKGGKIPAAISAVNITDGSIITFTDHYALEKGNIKTVKMCDTYDMISSTVSFMGGLSSYRYGGGRLCDYSCWYGSPVHPLKLAGFAKILSFSYLPKTPETPYEALAKRTVTKNGAAGEMHIITEFEQGLELKEYVETALSRLESCAGKIILNTLF